ncbi:conserved hypothetical protein [Candidatus Defluviicoccus seviourii]|uniref:ATPase AAA-type core domain-containing protein n=2 Tax=root TaxID=1 RepID=A0A564WHJ4_9PROT|nr:conserved hypothetical protein [uncultured Defluviicoccus sp.]VUX47033.1 conserved hypothetical protein [Candidatus Defluviicoccus seviourii]
MLLRFAVENHLSIKEKQELSLVASSLKDREEGLIASNAAPGKRVLPAAVIYGANASGKTNLLRALGFMRGAVLFSHNRGEPGERIPRSPFRLDPACADAPSTFELDFVVEGERYHYGFEALDDAFQSEWLYAFPSTSNRRQMLFERKAGEAIAFDFGRGLKGRNRVIADLTRPNSLFLSTAAQNNHEQLSPVARFFSEIRTAFDIDTPGPLLSRLLSDGDMDPRVIEFLKKIGTGIVGFERREEELPEEARTFSKALAAAFATVDKKPPQLDLEQKNTDIFLELAHQDCYGNPVYFDVGEESAGTQRLLGVLGRVYRVLDKGDLLVIDELDASLHTQASEAVLALVSSAALNPKGAQLIATTHDTNLLRSEFLRRDQIWFTEKDEGGATHLYPLSDFSTRKGDNIEKGYLQGRFGAIPFAGSAADLLADG